MKKTIIINNRYFGKGSDELGEKLMGNFLRKLWGLEKKPEKIVFYNSGVLLLAEGSSALDAVNELFRAGVDIIACGTCVTHFDIKDKLKIGRISNMQEIAEIITASENVVTI